MIVIKSGYFAMLIIPMINPKTVRILHNVSIVIMPLRVVLFAEIKAAKFLKVLVDWEMLLACI